MGILKICRSPVLRHLRHRPSSAQLAQRPYNQPALANSHDLKNQDDLLQPAAMPSLPSFSLLKRGSRDSSKKEQQLQQQQQQPSETQLRYPERTQSLPQNQSNGSAIPVVGSPVGNGSPVACAEDNYESGTSGAGSGTTSPTLEKQQRRNSKRDLLHDLISRGRLIGKQASTPLRGRRMSSQPPPLHRSTGDVVSHNFLFFSLNYPHNEINKPLQL